jgi:hypothetical protein
MPRKTFAVARAELLDYLEKAGWDVKMRGANLQPLKTPHATSRDGGIRLWFKPQAVWVSYGSHHDAGHARSLWVDIRDASPATVVAGAEKYR